MASKLERLRVAMASGDWIRALSIAVRFPRLGKHRTRITLAHEAHHHPRFYRELGKDPDVLFADGIKALRERYGDNE